MSKNDYPTLVLRLTNRTRSNWIKEGTGENGIPTIALDAPDGRRILNNSVIVKDGSYQPIRYIYGCDIIDKKKQDEQNIKPNPLKDNIWFEPGGVLTVVDRGSTKGLYAYLKNCEWNQDNPDRPESAEIIFEEVKAQVSAENALADDMALADALELVKELAYQKADKSWDYDMDRLDYMATLFGVVGLETPAEKATAIASIAKATPAFFLQMVSTKTAALKAEVKKAIHLRVISLAGDHASFVESKRAFLEFKAKPKEQAKRIDEVVQYMISAEAQQDYTDMVSLTEKAADKELALQS